MFNVSHKSNSLRYARAEGVLRAHRNTLRCVRENAIPKGDVMATARAAGISAAKRTSDWIVFCHPIPLDWVEIKMQVLEEEFRVTAEVESVWKTGVEMEALTAVTAALMNAYDMLKPLDNDMEITGIKVIQKKGGKSQFIDDLKSPLKTAVLVISDSTYQGTRQDKSGQVIKNFLADYPIDLAVNEILPDNKEMIQNRLLGLAKDGNFDLILTTGGTGFGPRDLTPEATAPLLDKVAQGIVEKIRNYGSNLTPYAMLSRAVAGTIGNTLVINLPGNPNSARESLHALFPGVLHIFPMIWGEGHKEADSS